MSLGNNRTIVLTPEEIKIIKKEDKKRMKFSVALKIKPGDIVALNMNKDGILWEVINNRFPKFTVQELGTTCRPIIVEYTQFFKPTKAQLNAYNKRKEKYYAGSTDTSDTSSN